MYLEKQITLLMSLINSLRATEFPVLKPGPKSQFTTWNSQEMFFLLLPHFGALRSLNCNDDLEKMKCFYNKV